MNASRDRCRLQIPWMLTVALGSCLLVLPGTVPAQDKVKPDPVEKKFTFEMRNKPWREVFEWLAAVSKLPAIIMATPTGTFSFVPPHNRQYTLGEVIDVLNEGLAAQKRVLVRREHSFTLAPAEERLDPSLVPLVRPDELEARGQSEIVRMIIPLRSPPSEQVVNAAMKLVGPFGNVVVASNQLVVQDSAGHVRQVLKAIQALDPAAQAAADSATVKTFSVPAGNAAALAEALRQMLMQARANSVEVVAPTRGGAGDTSGAGTPKKAGPGKGAGRPGKPDVPITITAAGNRLVVSSNDPEALALAGELVKLLQAPAAEGEFEVVRLTHARAENVARILDEAFNGPRPGRGGPPGAAAGTGTAPSRTERIRVVADPVTNSLLIKASPLDVVTIRNLLRLALDTSAGDERPAMRTWIIPLKHARAAEIVAAIKPLYRDRQLSLGVDERTNTLLLACPEAVHEDVRRLVGQLEELARDAAREEKGATKKRVK